jgi:hypothetical protein
MRRFQVWNAAQIKASAHAGAICIPGQKAPGVRHRGVKHLGSTARALHASRAYPTGSTAASCTQSLTPVAADAQTIERCNADYPDETSGRYRSVTHHSRGNSCTALLMGSPRAEGVRADAPSSPQLVGDVTTTLWL